MEFKKEIWYLFKLNRDEFNRFDRKALKVLMDVFQKGKKAGQKEEQKMMKIILKGRKS
jgi:hypothetical protein